MHDPEAIRRAVPPAVSHPTVYALALDLREAGTRVDILEYRGVTSKPRPYLPEVGVLDDFRSGHGHTVWGRVVDGVLYWMMEPHGVLE